MEGREASFRENIPDAAFPARQLSTEYEVIAPPPHFLSYSTFPLKHEFRDCLDPLQMG